MWRDCNKIGDVIQAASVWLLTLEKQGCSTMLQAGTVLSIFHSYMSLLLFPGFVAFIWQESD